jgi:hypothetical protein
MRVQIRTLGWATWILAFALVMLILLAGVLYVAG